MTTKIFLLCCVLVLSYPSFCEAAHSFPFKGEIDFQQKKLSVTVKPRQGNTFSFVVTQAAEGSYQLVVRFKDFKTPFFPVSAVLESSFVMTAGGRSFNGKVLSHHTLVNYRPVEDFSGQFELKDKVLYLNAFSLGNVFGKGSVQVVPPHRMDFQMNMTSVGIDDFLSLLGDSGKDSFSGKADGDISISGVMQRLQLKGKLFSTLVGYYGAEYNSLRINFEGIYPTVYVIDSSVNRADDMTFNIRGMLDLSDRNNFQKQLEAFVAEPLVSKKGSNIEWTLKRVQSDNRAGTTELKYLLQKDDDLRMNHENGTGMLGVERKIEF